MRFTVERTRCVACNAAWRACCDRTRSVSHRTPYRLRLNNITIRRRSRTSVRYTKWNVTVISTSPPSDRTRFLCRKSPRLPNEIAIKHDTAENTPLFVKRADLNALFPPFENRKYFWNRIKTETFKVPKSYELPFQFQSADLSTNPIITNKWPVNARNSDLDSRKTPKKFRKFEKSLRFDSKTRRTVRE